MEKSHKSPNETNRALPNNLKKILERIFVNRAFLKNGLWEKRKLVTPLMKQKNGKQ